MEFNGSYVQSYNAIAKAKDCVLLPVGERSRKIKWQVPRKANGWKFGFGRANVWYASEDNEELKEVKVIANKIRNDEDEKFVRSRIPKQDFLGCYPKSQAYRRSICANGYGGWY